MSLETDVLRQGVAQYSDFVADFGWLPDGNAIGLSRSTSLLTSGLGFDGLHEHLIREIIL